MFCAEISAHALSLGNNESSDFPGENIPLYKPPTTLKFNKNIIVQIITSNNVKRNG